MAYDFSVLDAHIKETEDWLMREFGSIRTGRATPVILDSIKVEAYGARTPISQVASISIEDSRTLRISPWDKSLLKPIEKAIQEANLGISVMTDDQGLRVIFPELTAERRTMLIKVANEKVEQAKVTLRGHRTDAIKKLEADEKEGGMGQDDVARYKEDIQKKIDAGNSLLEVHAKKKHEEISL